MFVGWPMTAALSVAGSDVETTWSPAWLRALTIAERLSHLRPVGPNAVDSRSIDDRLARWSAQLTLTGEPIDLADVHGCTEEELRAVLNGPSVSSDGDLSPPWWWRELRSDATARDGDRRRVTGESGFLVLIEPLIASATARLTSHAETLAKRHPAPPFHPGTVHEVLLPPILRRLDLLVSPSAVLEMHAAKLEGALLGETARERYELYLELARKPETRARFFELYPVLGRLAVTALYDWIDASEELLDRLALDWNVLREAFGLEGENDVLVGYDALGDPHCGGRRVAVCAFKSGFRVVYKPRSVENEERFQHVLRWVNERSSYDLRTLRVIDRVNYGWAEYAEPRHCESMDEVRRFYRRQGAYIAILYILAAHDFHHENVIAAGDQPVMVDLEAIAQPASPPNGEDFSPAERVASELGTESVLRIGLLPSRMLTRDDHEGLDLSGLGAVSDQVTPLRLPTWENEGLDTMRQVLAEANLGAVYSNPIPPGSGVTVGDFAEEVVAGFRDMYDLFLRERDALFARKGPMSCLRGVETRAILRPTVAYAMALRSSFHPQLLSEGLSRELHLDRLLGTPTVTQGPSLPDVRSAERQDLWRLDIPRFATRTDSRDLWSSSGTSITNYLPESGLDAIRRRLQRMSDDERDLQSWMIATSIATNALPTAHGHLRVDLRVDRPRISTSGGYLDAAVQIGERLVRQSIAKDGTAMWIGLTSGRDKRWRISPVGPGLYEGLGGIAVFLAELGRIVDDRRYAELARAALETSRAQIARGAFDASIAGFTGRGGHVYTLSRLGVVWDDSDLLDQAEAMVREIAPLVDDDVGLDVMAGSAGCIGALLALHSVRSTDEILHVATQCGDKLLASAVETPDGLGWLLEHVASRPLGGFAHGTAGAAWALLELFGLTGETRFRDAAVEAIRYDRSLFSPAAGNWLDLREDVPADALGVRTPEGFCLAHWCHGSTGIGLSRIRALRHWEDELVLDEIKTAVDATIAHGFGTSHCLCHGDFGNAELLIEAQPLLPDQDLPATIARLSWEALETMEERGCISGHVLGLESPGLMMGLAGIGYGLLRLEAPQRVPSILLLDPAS